MALCLLVSCVKSYWWLTDWPFERRHRLSFTIRQQVLAGKHRRSHFQYCTIEQYEMTQSQSSSWRYQGLRKVIFYYGNPRGLKASQHPRGNLTIRASAYTPVVTHWIQCLVSTPFYYFFFSHSQAWIYSVKFLMYKNRIMKLRTPL